MTIIKEYFNKNHLENNQLRQPSPSSIVEEFCGAVKPNTGPKRLLIRDLPLPNEVKKSLRDKYPKRGKNKKQEAAYEEEFKVLTDQHNKKFAYKTRLTEALLDNDSVEFHKIMDEIEQRYPDMILVFDGGTESRGSNKRDVTELTTKKYKGFNFSRKNWEFLDFQGRQIIFEDCQFNVGSFHLSEAVERDVGEWDKGEAPIIEHSVFVNCRFIDNPIPTSVDELFYIDKDSLKKAEQKSYDDEQFYKGINKKNEVIFEAFPVEARVGSDAFVSPKTLNDYGENSFFYNGPKFHNNIITLKGDCHLINCTIPKGPSKQFTGLTIWETQTEDQKQEIFEACISQRRFSYGIRKAKDVHMDLESQPVFKCFKTTEQAQKSEDRAIIKAATPTFKN